MIRLYQSYIQSRKARKKERKREIEKQKEKRRIEIEEQKEKRRIERLENYLLREFERSDIGFDEWEESLKQRKSPCGATTEMNVEYRSLPSEVEIWMGESVRGDSLNGSFFRTKVVYADKSGPPIFIKFLGERENEGLKEVGGLYKITSPCIIAGCKVEGWGVEALLDVRYYDGWAIIFNSRNRNDVKYSTSNPAKLHEGYRSKVNPT